MGWFIGIGILMILACIPLGIKVSYDIGGPIVKILAGPIKITLFPRQKQKKEIKQKKSLQTEKSESKETPAAKHVQANSQASTKQTSKSSGRLKDFFPLVKMMLDFLGDLRRKIRLDDLYLRLILASSDPCDLAINYGKTWAAVGNLLPVLEKFFVIKNRDIQVECDFTAPETTVIARAEVTITFGRLVSLIIVYGFRAIKEYLSIRNQRKGGAAK